MADHGHPAHHKKGDCYSNASARRILAIWLIATPIALVLLQKTAYPAISEWLPFFDLRTFDFFLIFLAGLLFVGFWALMDKFMVVPYLDVITEREKSTIGAEQKAKEDLLQAAKLREEFDLKIREIRVEAMREKLARLQTAKDEASAVIEKSEHEAEEILRAARWEIGTSIEKAREEVGKEVNRLVAEVVTKIKSPPQLAGKERRM